MDSTKERILHVFEEHVSRKGYSGAILDEVARELRISKKTIYVHYDGKRDIYAHIVARQAMREQMRLASVVAALPSYAARLEALLKEVLTTARTHLAKTSEAEWLEEFEIAGDVFRKATGDLLRDLVAGGMEAGEFGEGDPDFIEKMVGAMIVEYLLLLNADPGYDRDDELVRRIIKFVG